MEFFIRKGSTEPILKMRLIDDGKNDKSSFNDKLVKSYILFDMYNSETKEPCLLNETCHITTRTKKYDQTTDEYYITFKFNEEQTSVPGRYEGVISIYFWVDVWDVDTQQTERRVNDKLILPIKEKLFINII